MNKLMRCAAACTAVLLFAACSAKSEKPSAASQSRSGAPTGQSELAPAAKDPIVIKIGHEQTIESNSHKAFEKFEELVEAGSKGQISVEIMPNAQLGNENDLVEGVKMGTLHMSVPSAGALSRFYAPFSVFMVPYYLDGSGEAEQYQNLVKIANSEVGEQINNGLIEATGMRALDIAQWYGNRNITSNVPIRKPEDLKGIRIRTPDAPVNTEPMKACGAAVTPMAFGEVYMALSQGVIDAQENPNIVIFNKKFYEVQKYLSLSGHISQNQVVIINEAFFQSLTPEQQELLQGAMKEADVYASELQVKENNDILDTMAGMGIEIIRDVDVAAFKEATSSVANVILDEEGLALLEKVREVQKS
ncbi:MULTISPECIES: TRAP transporter substrate-binding protein [Anaerotruncus]|uniref:TRAP transporter substrate-binding protein n=1 Tax=Anaerotruncus TaxID=244127 RepID=UPI0013146E37|nr:MULTISPECIES: TRAP transporter substrate-binding protein [Anaerotruncus]